MALSTALSMPAPARSRPVRAFSPDVLVGNLKWRRKPDRIAQSAVLPDDLLPI